MRQLRRARLDCAALTTSSHGVSGDAVRKALNFGGVSCNQIVEIRVMVGQAAAAIYRNS